jgi:hypothetical protein
MKRKRIRELRAAPVWLHRLKLRERLWRLRVSARLRRWAAGVPPGRLRWYCFFFVLGGCLAYTWILVTAIAGRSKEPNFRVITVPVMVGRPAAGATNAVRPSFRRWLDSVNADPVLKKRFDSLRAARPGFADTIRRLEELVPGH